MLIVLMPRVNGVKRHVACHMGICQPGQATPLHDVCSLNSPEGEAMSESEMVYAEGNVVSLSSRLQGNAVGMDSRLQAPFNALQHPRSMGAIKVATQTTLPHLKPFEWVIAWCKVSQGIAGVGSHCQMSRERLRMSSRRGGSRGRSASHRPEISPSSSVEITSEQNRPPGSNVRGSWGIPECGHTEHPAIRYRIPCAFANNTLIVSVTVEHCSSIRGRLETVNVPRVDMETPTVDFRRPVQKDEAGPSEPVQRSSCQDKEDSEKLKGPATDEPHTTDED